MFTAWYMVYGTEKTDKTIKKENNNGTKQSRRCSFHTSLNKTFKNRLKKNSNFYITGESDYFSIILGYGTSFRLAKEQLLFIYSCALCLYFKDLQLDSIQKKRIEMYSNHITDL